MASSLNEYLEDFYDKRVKICHSERSESREAVDRKMKDILSTFKESGAYKKSYIKAGSHPSGTKIKRADEFDFNVPLQVQLIWTSGAAKSTVPYKIVRNVMHGTIGYYQSPATNEVKKKFSDGFELIECTQSIPDGFLALGPMYIKNCEDVMYRGYIIPRLVRDNFFEKMKMLKSKMTDISLSPYEHGPAITFRLKRPGKYDISVDISPSIEMGDPIPLSRYNWPRQATRECLDQDLIEKVQKAGTHLVPKDDEFWSISFSTAEKILMSGIDRSGECRKMCHKILKSDIESWRGQLKTNFPGISSYVFKHLLFWYNEHMGRGRSQWRKENLGQRYIGMLDMLEKMLRLGDMRDYFDQRRNILENKSPVVLQQLAYCVGVRIKQLEQRL